MCEVNATSATEPISPSGLSHEALFYGSDTEYLGATVPFISEGLAADERVMVAVGGSRLEALQDVFAGADRDALSLVDMVQLGRNPARIIPAWRGFLDGAVAHGRGVRGIGEPIWAERRGAELVECQQHEVLLNLAFTGGRRWRLMCPYDVVALPPDVIEEARSSHPAVFVDDQVLESPAFGGVHRATTLLAQPLPEPPTDATRLDFALPDLDTLRLRVIDSALAFGLPADVVGDLELAAHEIATNSVRHGGGDGTLRIWADDGALVCEISDRGRLADPLVGRVRPGSEQVGGRGVWLANQLCDLVQIRSGDAGTVVRLHARSR